MRSAAQLCVALHRSQFTTTDTVADTPMCACRMQRHVAEGRCPPTISSPVSHDSHPAESRCPDTNRKRNSQHFSAAGKTDNNHSGGGGQGLSFLRADDD